MLDNGERDDPPDEPKMTRRAAWIRRSILSQQVRDVAALGPEGAMLKWWPMYFAEYNRQAGEADDATNAR